MSKLWQFIAVVWLALLPGLTAAATPAPVVVIPVSGAIGPASADHVGRSLARAQREGAQLAVLQMDTPGGLDTSMRQIIKAILASPVPVASFVAPSGARAASAGTYILYASHIAAMAPATNLGAATPVAIGMPGGKPASDPAPKDKPDADTGDKDGKNAAGIGDAMMEKVRNDAAAYLRSLAQLRGRSGDFAERAVREAASLSAEEALAQGVIELIAIDTPSLLKRLDGREVAVLDGTRTLATAGIAIERMEPDWRNRVLAALANPQVALILMMIGIYGLFFEFTSPGFGVPGVAGAISLLIALYAFQLLPVNWAGVMLLAVGAALMLAEAFLPSFGVLGVGGIIAFVVGGLFLMDADVPGFGVPLALIVGMALASAAIIIAIGTFAARSLRRPVVSGSEEMLGAIGTVERAAEGGGWWVAIHGEHWRARGLHGLAAGERVRVTGIDGLTLEVAPLDAAGGSPHPSDLDSGSAP